MSTKLKVMLAAFVAVFLCVLGIGLGYWFSRPSNELAHIPETAAPAQTLPGGSILLERLASDPTAKSAMPVPKGAVVERVAKIHIQPKSTSVDPEVDCLPVDLEFNLLRLEDGTKRLQLGGHNGEGISGYDLPVDTPTLTKKHWAAGLSYNPSDDTAGLWVDRDVWQGRVRLGAEVNQTRQTDGDTGVEVRLKLGVPF